MISRAAIRTRPRSKRSAMPLVAWIALLTAAAPAAAQLLVYEPFDYVAGELITGKSATGTNLSGPYTSTSILQLRAESPGLNYGALAGAPAVAANRLSQNLGSGAGFATVAIDQDLDTGAGTTTYFSALMTLDDSSNGNHLANITLTDDATEDRIFFGEDVPGARTVRVATSTDATGQLIADGEDLAFTSGQTLLLIGRYLNAPAADADSLHLVGYDTAAAITLPMEFDPADPNGQFSFALSDLDIDMDTISSITFTIRGDANNFIDELRIGTTYAAVIPEPSGAGLALGLSAAMVARSRRRG